MKSVSIRFPDDLYERLKKVAKKEYRSINDQVLYCVDFVLRDYEAEDADSEANKNPDNTKPEH